MRRADTATRRRGARLQADAAFQQDMAALAACATAAQDLEELLPRICREAAVAFGVPAVTIARLQEPGTLILVASSAIGAPIAEEEAGFLAAEAVRTRRAVRRDRAPADGQGALGELVAGPVASALVAPIVVGEAVLGIIALGTEEPDRFGEDDLLKATQLAYIVGGALNNARIYEREHRVAERLRELERWRTTFLHVMAHELRTPLGQVLGFVDLLGGEADRLSARGQRYLANARQAGGTLEHVVQRALDVLDLFGAEARLATGSLDLVALVEPVLATYGERATAKAIVLQVALPAQAVPVDGDGHRLRQVLTILLDNALNFVPREGTVGVAVVCAERRVELAVWNSGPAVPAEMAEQLFSQGLVEDSLTRRHGGAGLSLPLARRIAELHGGSLRLDPSAAGARFVLELPAAPAPPRKA